MNRLPITADASLCGRTAESVITHELMASDTYLRRLKTLPLGISVNGAHVRSTYRIALGDVLSIQLSDPEEGPLAAKRQSLIFYMRMNG